MNRKQREKKIRNTGYTIPVIQWTWRDFRAYGEARLKMKVKEAE